MHLRAKTPQVRRALNKYASAPPQRALADECVFVPPSCSARPRPKEPPKSITYGPRGGAGGGIIDEMLNDFPCSQGSLVWGVSKEVERHTVSATHARDGALYYAPYTFQNNTLEPNMHTRINAKNFMLSWVDGTMILNCARARRCCYAPAAKDAMRGAA